MGQDELNGLGWRLVLVVFLVAALVYGASPVHQNGDSYLYLPTAYSIVHDRSLHLDDFTSPAVRQHYGNRPTDGGNRANYFPWAPSLFFVPAVVGLDLAHAVGIGPGSLQVADGDPLMDQLQTWVASLICAAVVALIAAVAIDRLSPSVPGRRLVAIGVALTFAFATSLWSVASRALWQHGPSLLALALALWCVQRLLISRGPAHLRAYAITAGAALAASYAFRPGNATTIACVAGLLLVRQRPVVRFVAGGAAAVAVPWALVNWATYGSLLQPYYAAQRLGLHDDFGEALAANLVSPARGLLVFSPFLVLVPIGLWSRVRTTTVREGLLSLDRVLFAAIVIQWLAVSAYGELWWAGHSYGPRFLSDTLVLAAAPATPVAGFIAASWHRQRPRLERLALSAVPIVLVAWSAAVHAQGAVVRSTNCWNVEAEPAMPGRVWAWDDPQFTYGYRHLARQTC